MNHKLLSRGMSSTSSSSDIMLLFSHGWTIILVSAYAAATPEDEVAHYDRSRNQKIMIFMCARFLIILKILSSAVCLSLIHI